MAVCTCCCEAEAHPLCNGLCADCDRTTFCERCDCLMENEGWQPGEERERFCESCRDKNEIEEWIEETKAAVMALADQHGWDYDRYGWSGGFNTRSEYIELTRECAACREEADGDCACKAVKVRVSDHGSCYCREDFSLAMLPSGDDHTMADLERFLSK